MKSRKKRVFVKRVLDIQRTLLAYEQRMMVLSIEEFSKIEDKYLSSFDIFETYSGIELRDAREQRRGTHLDNSTFRLSEIADRRGIPIRGVTSQKQSKGYRFAALSEEEQKEVYYVGPNSSFTGDRCNVFSISRLDRRFVDDEMTNKKIFVH